jgi:hypothetical protein
MAKVVGLFRSWEEADSALADLRAEGINNRDIGLIAHSEYAGISGDGVNGQSKYAGNNRNVGVTARNADNHRIPAPDLNSDGDTDAMQTGAAVGGLAGLVAGVTALAIPGVGPLFVAGSIASVVTSTLAGVTAGALPGALVDAINNHTDVSESQAKVYAEGVKRGGVMLVAETNDAGLVRRVLNEAGAVDVDANPDFDHEAWPSNRQMADTASRR